MNAASGDETKRNAREEKMKIGVRSRFRDAAERL
jgi:hypothetical protein